MLPDAGTFWYRPHINETVQLEKGLYGALVVRGHDEPHLDGERVLVLDHLKLDRKGTSPASGALRSGTKADGKDTRLVNGEAEPEFEIAAGQAELAGPGDHRPGGPLPLPTGSVDLVIDRPGPRRPHRTAVRGHLNYRYMGASVSTESGLGE